MPSLIQDLRHTLRLLVKQPGFTLAVLVTLALGIGANTAIFSVVNSLLLKPLPYAQPDRLALLWGVETDTRQNKRSQVSATDVADWRTQNSVFEDLTTYGNWSATLTGAGEPERVYGMQVGDGYFSIMRGKPLLGRVFTAEDQIDGKDQVIVLGHDLWKRRFAGDPNIIGQKVRLGGTPYTIVGVMPEAFAPLPKSLVDYRADFYRPVAEKYDDADRSSRHLRAIGRLKPGVTIERAQSELSTIAARLEKAHPTTNSGYGLRVTTVAADTVGGLRSGLLLLLGAVAFVLLIACANVANMLLARASGRRREMAVRTALGAGRSRLIRQFLTESVTLAIAGGTLGLLLAWWGTSLIESLSSRVFPEIVSIKTDATVLSFTMGLSVLTGIIFGLAPAWGASKLDLITTLKDGARGSGAAVGSGRTRDVLVMFEVALALILLTGGGLLIRSVGKLRGVDAGFNTKNLLTMNITLPSAAYPKPEAQAGFFKHLSARLEAEPGIESAGYVSVLPLGKNFDGRGLAVEDQPKPRGQEISADLYDVTPGYLSAMKIPLLQGRIFSDQDTADSLPVALINKTMAHELWPNQNPVGKRIGFPPFRDKPTTWRTIVGVVEDVKQYSLDKEANMQFYLPEDQLPFQAGSIVVRTKAEPEGMSGAVRGVVHGLDKELALYDVATMDQLVSESISSRSLFTVLLGVFAVLALVLAAIGIYSVVSYSVSQRTHEIGVRVALGATSSEIFKLVLLKGMLPSGVGGLVGLAGAMALTRLLSRLLFEVSPTDPVTFSVIVAVLALVTLAACCLPARRATATDPIVALKYE